MSRPSDESRSVSTALGAAGRLLRDRPAAVLPAYLLALGVTAAARVPLTIGFGVAGAYLAATGRLEPLVRAGVELQEAAREADGGGLGGGAGTGVVDEIPPGVADAVANAVTPTVVASVATGAVAAVLVGFLARAVASAVTYGTVWGGLDGRPPLVAGVNSAGRWRTFLGIALVRVGVGALGLGVPALVAGVTLASLDGVTAAALGPLVVLVIVALAGVGGVAALVAWFLLAFAEPAAVVDERGTVGAVRASVGFVRDHPTHALGFVLVALAGYVAVGVVVTVANAAGAGRLGGIALPLLVVPLVETGATALYAGTDGPAGADRTAAGVRLRRALGLGWREFLGFLGGHPLAALAGVGLLAGGIVVGYATTAPYDVTAAPPADVTGVFGAVPVGPFLTLAANNWLVSVGLAYGGIAFGLPAVSGLLFNGVLVGALAGVYERTAFLALVGPHGVLELPVIGVAGGLGLHLGRVGWRAIRGRASPESVAGELQRAAFVLVGIGILLVVAAAVEAFLTPRIAAALLE